MKLDYIALFLVLFFLAACGSKSSSPDMMDDNALPTEETFKDIDLANNLKDCGKPLLLSDIVKDVEYVKLETQDSILVGDKAAKADGEVCLYLFKKSEPCHDV